MDSGQVALGLINRANRRFGRRQSQLRRTAAVAEHIADVIPRSDPIRFHQRGRRCLNLLIAGSASSRLGRCLVSAYTRDPVF